MAICQTVWLWKRWGTDRQTETQKDRTNSVTSTVDKGSKKETKLYYLLKWFLLYHRLKKKLYYLLKWFLLYYRLILQKKKEIVTTNLLRSGVMFIAGFTSSLPLLDSNLLYILKPWVSVIDFPGAFAVLQTRLNLPIVLWATYPGNGVALAKC